MPIEEQTKELITGEGGLILTEILQWKQSVGPGVCDAIVRDWLVQNRQNNGQKFREVITSDTKIFDEYKEQQSRIGVSLAPLRERTIKLTEEMDRFKKTWGDSKKPPKGAFEKIQGIFRNNFKATTEATLISRERKVSEDVTKLKLSSIYSSPNDDSVETLDQKALDELSWAWKCKTDKVVGDEPEKEELVAGLLSKKNKCYIYLELRGEDGGHALGVAMGLDSQAKETHFFDGEFRFIDPNFYEIGFYDKESLFSFIPKYFLLVKYGKYPNLKVRYVNPDPLRIGAAAAAETGPPEVVHKT